MTLLLSAMNRNRHLATGLATIALSAHPLLSQTQPASRSSASARNCPVLNGVSVTVNGDSVNGTGLHLDLRRSIDTTWRFDIANRQWTRPLVLATIAAGVGDTASRRPWHVCAGANASMQNATLTIRRARGSIHFAASLEPLLSTLHLDRTTTP